MEEGKSLDDLLNEQSEAEQVTEPEQISPEADGPPRDEHGRFAKKGEPEEAEQPGQPEESAPPAPEQKSEFDGKATMAERRKRQEAEERERQAIARIAELERQFQAIQNPPEPPPSLWENEEAWGQNLRSQATQEAVNAASLNAKLDMSEMMASQNHPDFDEKKALFLEMMQANPQLRDMAMNDRHPWERAYQIANNHATMQELGSTSIDDLKARIRAEVEAEMRGNPAPRVAPPTLSTERNAGQRTGPAWAGPRSLDELL